MMVTVGDDCADDDDGDGDGRGEMMTTAMMAMRMETIRAMRPMATVAMTIMAGADDGEDDD